MVEKEAAIVPQAGLHARPAALFMKEAKSSLKLMTLGARHGYKVVIRAKGEDEGAAVDALVAILSREEEE